MTDSDILKHTLYFELTGVIREELIPFFDQHGRWLGERRSWRRSTHVTALKRMRGAFLPAQRRTSRCRAGLRLLTSLVWKHRSPLLITYCEVAGCVKVAARVAIAAPSLRTIGRHMHTKTTAKVDLPQLRRIGGDLDLRASGEVRAPWLQQVGGKMLVSGFDFPALREVGGRLSILWTSRISAPRLRFVGGTLHAHAAVILEAPQLRFVGSDIAMGGVTDRVSVPLLTTVGGSFIAAEAEHIVAHCLQSVGGYILTCKAKRFYRTSVACGKDWYAHPEAVARWNVNQAARNVLRQPDFEL